MGNPTRLLDTDAAIRTRKTTKVLANTDLPLTNSKALVEELLAAAGMAPFHRACDACHRQSANVPGVGGQSAILPGIEPWRFYLLDAAGCRALKRQIPQENAGKIPAMLSAADALLMATWLPNPASPRFEPTPELRFEPTETNMEHIAATSAAIQNLLLAATARGVASYWSSGGVLRSREVFQLLQVPANQILLGAVFLFPRDSGDAEVVGSKLRDKRSSIGCWSQWVMTADATRLPS